MASQPPRKDSKKEDKAKKEGKDAKKEVAGTRKSTEKEVVGTRKSVEKKEAEEEKKKKKDVEVEEIPEPATHPVDSRRVAPRDETWQDELHYRRSTKKESLKIPKEKVNDPTLPQDDADDEDEGEELEGRKSINESRTRRPTTPIPEEKKSLSPEAKTQVMVAQESSPERESTAWTVAGGRATLTVPSPFPPDQSPVRGSIGTSRTRRPTTPIPIPKPSDTTTPPTPVSDEEPDGGGGGSSASSHTTPSIQNNPSLYRNTPTVINRVSVASTRFPGSFFENILPYPQNIQITVTSPEGHTTTPTVHLQTMTYEGGEPYSPIRHSLSRAMQRSEPNIRH